MFYVVIIIVLALFLWIWFFETRAIIIRTTKIATGWEARYVLISDIHAGLWKRGGWVKKIIGNIQDIPNIEAVFVAGDWIFYPTQRQLRTLFTPFRELRVPVYGTFGNHDWGRPGPRFAELLKQHLQTCGVDLIDGQIRKLPHDVTLIGIDDAWENPTGSDFLHTLKESSRTLVLAHNPDSILTFSYPPDLTLVGHSHCGQIRIPWLYKFFLPLKSGYEKGYYETPHGKLYVTCGLGETDVLPFRLFNRPAIDIIETY
jgi:uncharacterized protein